MNAPIRNASTTKMPLILAPPSCSPLQCVPASAPAEALTDVKAVQALRERAVAEMQGWGAEAAAEAAALCDDLTLERFLQARPEGVDEALKMLQHSCEWRVARGTSRLFNELHPNAPESLIRHRLARAHFYGGAGGSARDGTPYFVERLGAADLAGYSREPALLRLMLDAYVAHLELTFRTVRLHSAATGTLVKALMVIDASGLSISTLRHLSIIKEAASLGPPNYPEGTKRVLVVNAPRFIAALWAVISPLLPARTRQKVSIISARHSTAALDELIAPEELPLFLGGRKPDAECAVAQAEPVPVGASASLFAEPLRPEGGVEGHEGENAQSAASASVRVVAST